MAARPGVAALPRVVPPRATGEVPAGTEEVPTALLAAILARLEMAPAASGGVPAWLAEAVGNPLTYDAAASNRKDVCVRVKAVLYRSSQTMKERLGLRTTAARERPLRSGSASRLVVARKMPTRCHGKPRAW